MNPTRIRTLATVLAFAAAGLTGCHKSSDPVGELQKPNPASENCAAKGGKSQTEKRPDGGEFSVCVFADNQQCEEWALQRGECPVGGVNVTGYATPAGRYCAITGGTYAATPGTETTGEKGNCTLPGGKVCDADEYYAGTCTK